MIRQCLLALMVLCGSVCFAHDTCDEDDLEEVTVSTTLEEIYVENDNMFLNVRGKACPVRSLKKQGNGWMATTVSHRSYGTKGYCPRGHQNCEKCGMCHLVKQCWYAVPFCNQWK